MSEDEILSYPVAVQQNNVDDIPIWNAIRAEEHKYEKYEHVVLQTPKRVKWSTVFLLFMNLPNSLFWNFFVLATIFLNYFASSTCNCFIPERIAKCVQIYIICDSIYFCHFVFLLLHRFWKKVSTMVAVRYTKNLFLVIDAITFLPQELVFMNILGPTHSVVYYCRLVTYLRLHRLLVFIEILGGIQEHRRRWFIILYLMVFLLVLHVDVCILYLLGCHDASCDFSKQWTMLLRNGHLPTYTVWDWYLICFYTCFMLMSNVGFGDYYSVSFNERMFVMVVMLTGFLLITGVLIAMLAIQMINMGYRKTVFFKKVADVKKYLKEIEASKTLRKQLLGYYQILWINKSGIKYDKTITMLPRPLQMELTYDINITYLQKSLLFNKQPESFLRKVSLLMRNEFFLPGDVVFYQGVVKGHVIFIANGVLEILSDEDDQSPIISFKTGTILGEVSTFLSIPAKATVRAATYTELQVMNRQELMKVLLDHRETSQALLKIIKHRIDIARQQHVFVDKERTILNLLVSSEKEYRPIKLLKNNLCKTKSKSSINYKNKAANVNGDEDNFNKECLPLYNLSKNITSIEPPLVCLTYKFPWILDPDSSLIWYWTVVVLILQLFTFIAYPYSIAFERNISGYVYRIGVVADVFYIFDIYIRCTTAIKMKHKKIKKMYQIVSYRLKEINFYVDIFSLFMLEILPYAFTFESNKMFDRWFSLLYLNRLLRIWRMHLFIRQLQNQFYKNAMTMKRIMYCFYLMLILYWTACFLYLTTCPLTNCIEDSWFFFGMIDSIQRHVKDAYFMYPLETSIYFACMVFLRVGYGVILPETQMDVLVVIAFVILGIVMVSYFIAEFSAALTLQRWHRKNYQYEMTSFESFLKENYVSLSLRRRIMNYFCLQWYYNEATNRNELLKTAPINLRSSLEMTEVQVALTKSPLFQVLDIDFLMMIAKGAKVQVLPSNEVIFYAGNISRDMYILQKGYCEVLLADGTFVRKQNPGSELGTFEMIFGVSKKYTVRTVTNCKVIRIQYRTVLRAMSMFPSVLAEARDIMDNTVIPDWVHDTGHFEERLRRTNKQNKPKYKRFVSRIKSFFDKSFIFTWKNCRNSKGCDNYWQPFKSMGKYRFCQFFLLPITIHPEGPFLKIWFFTRLALILTIVLIEPFYIAVTPYAYKLYPFLQIVWITHYVDIYLLLHVGYFNNIGILVSHPKYTAKRYLTHTFILDILAVFPVKYIVKLVIPLHYGGHDEILHMLTDHMEHCYWDLTSILLLHRFLKTFTYVEGNLLNRMNFLHLFKLVPLVILLINLTTGLLFSLNCGYKLSTVKKIGNDNSEMIFMKNGITYYGYLYCQNSSWLMTSQFQNYTDPFKIYLVGFYWVTATLTSLGPGDIVSNSERSMILVIITIVTGTLLFGYFFAILASGQAQFSTGMADYQQKLGNLKRFMRKQHSDSSLQKKVFEYYEYVWKRTLGVRSQELCQQLNTALTEDTVLFLYERTLREVPLFENVERSFIRVIAKHLNEQYFLKGDTIVKCFDVHSNIYIIYRGKVEVLTRYNEMIACMGPGGLFGNISQVSVGCSSVTITANRNVDVLVISSQTFYTVIQDYPQIKHNMEVLLKTGTDYIMPTTIIEEGGYFFNDKSLESQEVGEKGDQYEMSEQNVSTGRSVHTASSVSEMSKEYNMSAVKASLYLCLPHKWFRFALEPENGIFKIMKFLICIVTYFDIISITYTFVSQDDNVWLLLAGLLVEPIFYFRIFITFHTAYIDRYGNYVGHFRKIFQNYIKNKMNVFWDVFPNIPFEILALAAPLKYRFYTYTWLRLFHLLRFHYILQIFREGESKLFLNRCYLLTGIFVFWICVIIHLFACIWYFIACPFGNCLKNSWVGFYGMEDNDRFEVFMIGMYYIVGLATMTGIGDIIPISILEVAYTTIVILLCRFFTAFIIGAIMTVLNLSMKSLINYEHKIENLQDFLRNQNLSSSYVTLLWVEEKGAQMPYLIRKAPYVMRCAIMKDMFEQHLKNSFLFNGLNEALLRQLTVRLKRIIFFAGNYIVQHGDTDQNMYFIHSGEVSVLTVHPNLTETRHDLLHERDMFGLAQGLYHGVPHHFFFRAETKVQILALNLDDWSYMLKFFPEDRMIIYNRAKTLYTKV